MHCKGIIELIDSVFVQQIMKLMQSTMIVNDLSVYLQVQCNETNFLSFPHLKVRFCNQLQINSYRPKSLIQLVQVELGVDWNECVGDSDITDINFLKQCVRMEKLSIYRTQITDLPLENAIMLKYIQIYGCNYIQNLNGLEGCPELEKIDIGYSNISSIVAIENHKNLKKITIWGCKQITDYNILEGCANLTYLCIEQTNISDISPIANLKNLETLKLESNDQLPEQFKKQMYQKQKIQQFLNQWKQTNLYKDYKQKQKLNQLRAMLMQTQENILQFKNNIQQQVYQYKVNLVKSMEKIIEFQ